MALKPGQIAFEEACLRERLNFVRVLKEELQQEEGLVAQTVGAYSSIIDGAVGCAVGLVGGPPPHAASGGRQRNGQADPAATHELRLRPTGLPTMCFLCVCRGDC